MRFSLSLETQNQDIIGAILAGSFVRGLVDGSLKKEIFDYYIVQDIAYLKHFAQAAALCAARCPEEDAVFFQGVQQAAYQEITNINAFYAKAEGFQGGSGRTPALLHYSAFILSLAALSPVEIAFAGLYPCPWLYMHIGQKLGQNVPQNHPYFHWLSSNGAPSYPAIVEEYALLLDRYAENNPSLRPAMEEAARTAFFHEYYFWHDAFGLKNFYAV